MLPLLLLLVLLLHLHLTARRRKTKRSHSETGDIVAAASSGSSKKIWQRLHFDFPSRILPSNAFIIYQPASNRQQTVNSELQQQQQLNSADSCCSCQRLRRRHYCPHYPTAPPSALPHVAYLLVLTVRQQQQLETQTPTVALVE